MTASPALVAFLGAGTIAVFVVGLWFPWYVRNRELRRRLSSQFAPNAAMTIDLGGRRRQRGIRRPRSGAAQVLFQALDTRLERASVDLSASEVVAAMGILAAAGALSGGILLGPLGIVLGAAALASLPLVWLSFRHRSRQSAFREQLPDTIGLLASTVRAGHSLLQGLEQVARESLEPTRSAMEQTVREIGLGASQEDALERLVGRFPSDDLVLIVSSINIHHQVGGSLAAVLDTIADTLRERVRIAGDIRALTSQQRFSAYVLALLPVFVAAALFFISRDYIQLLFQGALRIAAAAAAVMVVAGFFLMQRMASIDV